MIFSFDHLCSRRSLVERLELCVELVEHGMTFLRRRTTQQSYVVFAVIALAIAYAYLN